MDEPITAIEPAKKRKINLTKSERLELAERKQLEHAVALFLDLTQDRTTQQVADEVGVSLSALKRLTKKPEFQDLYDETSMTLGHHPRLQALQSALPDLIPLAQIAMRRLLGPGIAHTAQVAAIKLLYETLGVADMQDRDDPAQINNFLKAAGVSVEGDLVINANLPIPPEYQAAFARLMGTDITAEATRIVDTPSAREAEVVDVVAEDLPDEQELID